MRSSFFEYNVAMAGLFTARGNLSVISHNVANAGIPGYSRQYTLQRATTPLSFGNGRGMYGTGSEVYGVAQIRDIYLDRKYWQQNGILGEYTSKNSQLSVIETVFNDLSDAGVRSAFSQFFDRLQDLTTNTPDATYRTNMLLAADTLAQMVRTNAEVLQKQQRDVNNEVSGVVQQINSLGIQITNLNEQIHQYESDGSAANDLRDQRALLIDRLSVLVNVEVEERDYSTDTVPNDKRYIVMINGYDFVNHLTTRPMICVARDFPSTSLTSGGNVIPEGKKHNEMDVAGLYDIYFTDTGTEFNIYQRGLSGTLKGLIDMRDGNNSFTTVPVDPTKPNGDQYTTTVYKGIPFYMNKLNTLVRTFAKAFNEGVDVNNNPIPGVTGHRYAYNGYGESGKDLLFTYDPTYGGTGNVADFPSVASTTRNSVPVYGPPDPVTGNRAIVDYVDYSQLNCMNFAVNPKMIQDPSDPFLLATSSQPNTGESRHDAIKGFTQIATYPSLFREGKLMDFIIGTSDHLAIDRMQADNFEISYSEMTAATDNHRISVSGVDINEEMLAMIKYNQLYQACAKLVNVINGIYDTMINRLGLQ